MRGKRKRYVFASQRQAGRDTQMKLVHAPLRIGSSSGAVGVHPDRAAFWLTLTHGVQRHHGTGSQRRHYALALPRFTTLSCFDAAISSIAAREISSVWSVMNSE